MNIIKIKYLIILLYTSSKTQIDLYNINYLFTMYIKNQQFLQFISSFSSRLGGSSQGLVSLVLNPCFCSGRKWGALAQTSPTFHSDLPVVPQMYYRSGNKSVARTASTNSMPSRSAMCNEVVVSPYIHTYTHTYINGRSSTWCIQAVFHRENTMKGQKSSMKIVVVKIKKYPYKLYIKQKLLSIILPKNMLYMGRSAHETR